MVESTQLAELAAMVRPYHFFEGEKLASLEFQCTCAYSPQVLSQGFITQENRDTF